MMKARLISVKDTLVYILGWIVSSLLLIADLIGIRELTLDILTWIQARIEASRIKQGLIHESGFGWKVELADRLVLWIGAVIVITLVILIEYYLRKSRAKGRLVPNLLKIIVIEVVVVVVCYLLVGFI